MGLDAVEIVMAVEEAFGIQIEDSEVEVIMTPGQLIDLILTKVSVVDSNACLTQRAFNMLRRFCVQSWAMQRDQLKPAIAMCALVPSNQRRKFAVALGTALEIPPPPLVRPRWLGPPLTAVAVGCGVAVPLLSRDFGATSSILGLMAAGVAGFFVVKLTEPLKTDFPKNLSTVGNLAQWIMSSKPGLAVPEVTAWTRQQVAARVRQIVIQVLNCESTYREDAHFIKELGLG